MGTQSSITMDLIYDQFRVDVIEAVKISIARYMKEEGVNVNELGTEYKSLSRTIFHELQETFAEYGVELLNFNIEDISFDENDKGYQTVMDGIAEQAKLNKLGINYVQQRQLDIAQDVAQNQGAGIFMGAGMGLGVGTQVGQTLGNVLNQGMNMGQQQPQTPPPVALPSFYVAKNGATTGPFRLDELQTQVFNNEVTENTYVYRVGGTSWKFAKEEPEIAQIFQQMIPPPPPSMA